MFNLSEDMIIEVLSYLDMSDIIKLDLSFDCFKKYLVLRLKNKEYNSYKNIWYKGVYNNQYNKCFKCERYLLNDLHVLIICNNCKLKMDDIHSYPSICLDCVDSNNRIVNRGAIITSYCPCCINKRMHLGIKSYS
tara:strand:- start:587 stop:991 length:405 start_codon:yes stop_codon:yes gene_type:complete